MMIVATDAPLSNRLLNRVAKRATLGMARVGLERRARQWRLRDRLFDDVPLAVGHAGRAATLAENEGAIDGVFQAIADATEEAILNSHVSRIHGGWTRRQHA